MNMFYTDTSETPRWFLIVAGLALVWNLLGVVAYIMRVTMRPEVFTEMPETQRQTLESTPKWAIAAFAVAVNCGALGSLLLLLKRNLAGLFLQLSLAGVLVQMFHSLFISKAVEIFGPGELIVPILVLVIAVCLVLLAYRAQKKGWTS
jgi:hypothetical protein